MDAVEMPKQRLGGRRGKAFQGTESKLLVCMEASSGIRVEVTLGGQVRGSVWPHGNYWQVAKTEAPAATG